ncbi:MAG: pentachlorophenol monooxygenase [Chloroflexi bacterium]|nr:MAG: pentachlorophenol monooxygenase [Chloroflexota bacterium]
MRRESVIPETQVAVVGAGPVGLTLAARLAQHGIRVTLLEQAPRHLGEGSRALCMQRETIEIWARIGIGERVAKRGVQWRIGRTYYGTRELFSVELPGTSADHFPPFVNISQTEVEELLLDRCRALGVDLRWGHRLEGLTDDGASVRLELATNAGPGELIARYVVGTDGAHSTVRDLLGVGFPGHTHDDHFLICDIRARLPFPNERRFFFDPPWNPGRQVLIHPQPDDTWRIDWQIAPDTDIDAERADGRLDRRIRAVVGPTTDYDLAWMTVYRFHQRLADAFRQGNAFLAGDAAHLYAPFGARGLNSGAADAENLAWKLAWVLSGEASETLLDTYAAERRPAAEENLAVTDATMRFMAPRGRWQQLWRNLTLRGSTRFAALRRRVNSGRLAEPFSYGASPIVEAGPEDSSLPRHGAVAPDVQLSDGSRLKDRFGSSFVVLLAAAPPAVAAVSRDAAWPLPAEVVADVGLTRIYGPAGPRAWIVRPDGHLASSLPLTDSTPEAQLVRLAEMVGRAAGRGRGSAPG